MRISAIVCTHNRAPLLMKGLVSLVEQTVAVEDYEIIVVDNASRDETREVTCSVMDKASNLRYLYEPRLGLSHARNRGMNEADGEIVAFIDDDAIAAPEWLEMIERAFEGVDPRPACVGGKVEPIWEIPKPDWFPQLLVGYLSVLDLGHEARWCDIPREHLVGCNIAFLKEAALGLGGFNPLLGRKGQSLRGNEEIELLRKMKQRGQGIYYEPRAVVHHFIPKERLTKKWLIRRLYDEGLSESAPGMYESDEVPPHRGRRLARKLGSVPISILKAVSAENGEQRTLFQTQAAYSLGIAMCLLQCILLRRISMIKGPLQRLRS